ncbi:hypothetical protein BN946_scf184880.g3 [Trametes cinnabarina]|uniref:Proteophosphoglycan ppg4 n=1 Tax=Pycnoporus cinnabarinus TaxID=5643 RepID=A0A060SQD8_PYCCI|nr:hypothetical protein BN946_scf184880.g3 [Trametes cinnabarina]
MSRHRCTLGCAPLLILLALSAAHVRAAPTSLKSLQRFRPRQVENQNSPGSLPTTVWIPLVVVGLLFLIGLVVACGNRRFRGWSYNWGVGAAQAAGITTSTTPAGPAAANGHEVTADQLAGNGNATGGNGNAGTNRARRPRRIQRTPSQISTHSLPAYAKEPGEQEIVIVRGPDEEDMPIPITVTMPPVDEHGSDTPDGSFDLTRPGSMYAQLPNASHDDPLLQSTEHESQQELLGVVGNDPSSRRSFDSMISSEDNSQVHYLDDAPPYEVVVLGSMPDLPSTAVPHTALSTSDATPADRESEERRSVDQPRPSTDTRRRSLFMSIFNPRHPRMAPSAVPTDANAPEPRPSIGHGHTRDGSRLSLASTSGDGHPRPRSRTRIRHQPSHSGSGSMFSLISRTRSNGNLARSGSPVAGDAEGLTSPSMISLNSISAPLSHTLVRTEFTYPRGGPTPEQLRLISSRDSFARFGVPYGRDAIAFAASASGVDLEPPPGFDEVAQASVDATAGASPASSAENSREESPAVVDSAEAGEVDGSEGGGSHAPAQAPGPQSQVEEQATEALVTSDENAPAPESSSGSDPLFASSSSDAAALSSPSNNMTSSVPNAKTSAVGTTSNAAATPTTPTAPPSAFKAAFNNGSLPSRAASRASSYMTFATADESIYHSEAEPRTLGASRSDLHGTTLADEDVYESAAETPVNASAPSTPRLASRHLHENTDMTVTPDNR